MPIHDVGYRPWDGERTSQMARFWVITATGVRLAAKSKWVRRMMFFAWLPVLYWGIGFFIIEQTINTSSSVTSMMAVQSGIDDENIELSRIIQKNLKAGDLKNLEGGLDKEKIRKLVAKATAELDKAKEEARNKEKANKRHGKRKNGEVPRAPEPPDETKSELTSEPVDSKVQVAIEVLDSIVGEDRESEEDTDALPELLSETIKDKSVKANQVLIAQVLRDRFEMIPKVNELADGLERGDTEQTRSIVWAWLLMTFFRYPQALLILFLLGTITPSLISRDLRSRAFLLYFSRPIGKLEYIFGKLCIPIAFIVGVTTLPALALYVFAIGVSPDLSVFWSTWDIPFRIMAATVALVIPTASLALMLSSLTHESRFASFAWFAIWALGHGAWMAVLFAAAIQIGEPPFHPDVLNSSLVQNWSVLSLYNNLGDIQSWIFGFGEFADVWRGILALAILTVFSLIILYRRVSAPIQI